MDAIITTPRLYFRPMCIDDRDDLVHLFGDPVAMQYFPSVKTVAETVAWIEKVMAAHREYGYSFYACVHNETTRCIGYCGLYPQKDVNGRDEIEIGYGLIRDYWHRGLATEAAIACREYGFHHFGFNRLISLIRPENLPSIGVATRNGMKRENDIVRWGMLHGVYSVHSTEIPDSQP